MYISQILVASALGAVVEAVGSVRVIPMVASGGSLLGFFTALFLVIYPAPNHGWENHLFLPFVVIKGQKFDISEDDTTNVFMVNMKLSYHMLA